ncbi:MAG: prefoldin subunit alpha [Candidatus Methanomethylophilaceae archaeon]|jgi:prefoldin alpha subunit|nr:prefoldin subunit alpha [Candidatus Methanomethylophilaceae archaeon]NLF33381.1 prefoldin subunit alpha [Thermoplasmatales archaeon]
MNDDELRQALTILDSYRSQLEALTRQARLLQATYEETMGARMTLNAFEAAAEGDEILVPIGASSFVNAKVTGKRTAVVGIGNRLSVEKDITEAAAQMDAALSELSEALKKSSSALNEMELAAGNLQAAIQSEYQRRQQ